MISVIVPVYHVEPYLANCITSIQNQTYGDLEIILVDDGSKDECVAICDEYAQKDSRIKVIHKENGGLSYARNVGIQAAKGEYIAFVDSDDYIQRDMCKTLVNAMEDTGADMVLSGFFHKYLNEEIPKVPSMGEKVALTREEFAEEFLELYQQGFLNMPWTKLYKRAQIFDMFPENLSLGEDLLFNLKYMENIEKLAIVNEPFYYYIQERGTANLSRKKRKDKLEIAEHICRATERFYHDSLKQQGKEAVIYSRMVSEVLCDIAESVYDEGITKSNFSKLVERYYHNEYLKEINRNIPGLPTDLRILNSFFQKKRIKSLWWLCRLRKLVIRVVKGR